MPCSSSEPINDGSRRLECVLVRSQSWPNHFGGGLTDSQTSEEVIGHSKHRRLELQLDPVGGNQTGQGDDNDEGGVQPVNVLVPVGPCYRLLRDVCGRCPLVCGQQDCERLGEALTRFASIVVLLPKGNVVGPAVWKALGLGHRHLRRGRRHGEGIWRTRATRRRRVRLGVCIDVDTMKNCRLRCCARSTGLWRGVRSGQRFGSDQTRFIQKNQKR